jgi:hypothetical protein
MPDIKIIECFEAVDQEGLEHLYETMKSFKLDPQVNIRLIVNPTNPFKSTLVFYRGDTLVNYPELSRQVYLHLQALDDRIP